MRQPRLKAPAAHGTAYYHCISRVVDRQYLFGPLEKEHFVALMREYEVFCGVRVITYCVLSNHFHLLVEVPKRPPELPSDSELLSRVEQLSGTPGNGTTRQRLEEFRQKGDHVAAEALRIQLAQRMWDISSFMKLLKQRFTQWFNHQRGRKGTLWEERFKSVLVEGAGSTLATMAAYIDLNPVRAGLTTDPVNYRWCGYAEAMAGRTDAQKGLQTIMAGGQHVAPGQISLAEALQNYRRWLYAEGELGGGTDEQGRPLRLGLAPDAVAEVIANRGKVPLTDYLKVRVRYFTDGAVLGTRGFVDAVFNEFRHRFSSTRRDGARRMRGVDVEDLFALRDLRTRAFG